MKVIAIGPFIFGSDELAGILGIFAFILLTSILARRVDRSIAPWSTWAMVAGFAAARLGHVGLHWQTFRAEPLRALAFWQGGFEPVAGLAGILIVSLFYIRSLKAGLAAAAALGLGAIVWIGVAQLTEATLGQPAPTFALQKIDGSPVTVSGAGKPVVINLWASWCPPCRREMPLLADVAAARTDVVFLFVNQGEAPHTIRSYLDREKLSIGNILLDQSMLVPRHYNTPGLPITLFLRSDGTLASMHVGEISREALNAKIGRIAGPS